MAFTDRKGTNSFTTLPIDGVQFYVHLFMSAIFTEKIPVITVGFESGSMNLAFNLPDHRRFYTLSI